MQEHNHNKIVAITGLTGVGKDYLTSRCTATDMISVVNWGTLLGAVLNADRDTMMQNTSPLVIKEMQYRVCQSLIDIQPVGVTCHTVRSQGLKIEYDINLERKLNAFSYIFLSAPSEVIYERILQRNSIGLRKSEVLSVQQIDELQITKRNCVSEIANQIGSNFIEILNVEEYTNQNIATIDSVLLSMA